jgi:hypothetical protein
VACILEHAYATCGAQSCAISSCQGTWDDCDGRNENGCEVDLASSTTHCGGCNDPCLMFEVCCNGSCCDGSCCGGACCPVGRTCCNGVCCPFGETCDGGTCARMIP